METDLHRVIRTQELSDDHCQYFIYQVGHPKPGSLNYDVGGLNMSNVILLDGIDGTRTEGAPYSRCTA